jgi:hypothetical protein
MNPASASEIADQLLGDLAPVDPGAADALGLEPANVMPALAPDDFATRHEAYLRAHRSLDALGTPTPAELVLGEALRERVDAQLARLWRQARDAAERRPGFDLRAFHMRALRLGPLGLGPLREVMS